MDGDGSRTIVARARIVAAAARGYVAKVARLAWTTPAARPLTRADILSTPELAELLGTPRSTVHELARRGDLPARRVGRRWLFLRERLVAAITPVNHPAAWRSRRDA
jgi:excisionase family DNA binding protein